MIKIVQLSSARFFRCFDALVEEHCLCSEQRKNRFQCKTAPGV